ncbi:hypothetical protein QQF73_03430 [Marinobacter sp. M216]|uniref:Toprim domain-containing protein n=1 Tax=Marinobacter albus TaxID=3030833 RepID=A0ABT7H8H8_9GAMM|nr:hypothetical protein [Marinobacter sp. M216]MDK9556664.1 hypothetical protein [Marinobacter sp. M216]
MNTSDTSPQDQSLDSHPYLVRKQIDPQAMRELGCWAENIDLPIYDDDNRVCAQWRGSALFRPLFDTNGDSCGQERILAEKVRQRPDAKPNDKLVTRGGKVAGTFTPIGFSISELGSLTGRLIVCAGVADGYRLHEATTLPVACGVGEANIPGNVRAIREKNPNLKLVVAVDNDTAGKSAGIKSGCSWTCPQSAKDWSDVYQADGSEAVLAEYQEGLLPPEEPPSSAPAQEDDKQPQTDKIVAFVRDNSELFHDDNKTAYVRQEATGEVRALGGKAFCNWLTAAFYAEFGKPIRDQALREARMTLEGIAMQEHRPVYTRVASEQDKHWIDLAEPGQNMAVCLQAGEWSIEEAPVMFCRSDSTEPLPRPTPSGDISTLWKIANIPPDKHLLVISWLIECLRSSTPFPILELIGEQGSAKSTTQTSLRRIIDPNASDLRALPRNTDDLFVSSATNHVISLENVSYLPDTLQDAMCQISTGAGYSKRKLYSDSDEVVLKIKRPIILNGIAATVTQQDALSRALSIELPLITNACLHDELHANFERNRAQILGGLLDIAAMALQYLPDSFLPPDQRPRLLDFAYLGMAVAKAMELPEEMFMEQFNAAREDALERTLDGSPVALAILAWIELNPGRVQDLPAKQWFTILEDFRPRQSDAWPRTPKGLGDSLRRTAPALRQLGIECKCLGKIGSNVQWRIGQKKLSDPSRPSLEVVRRLRHEDDIKTLATSPSQSSSADEPIAGSQADKVVF